MRLSDDSWAVPLEHTPRDPCRPRVQLVPDPADFGAAGGRGDTELPTIDLRERPDLHVVQAEDQDTAGLNFPPSVLPSPEAGWSSAA